MFKAIIVNWFPYVNEKMAAMVPFELLYSIAVEKYVIKHVTMMFSEENIKKAQFWSLLPKHVVQKVGLSWDLEMQPTVLTLHSVREFFRNITINREIETVALIDLGHLSIIVILLVRKINFNALFLQPGLKLRMNLELYKDISPTSYNRNVKYYR